MSQPPTQILKSDEARRTWHEVIRRVSQHEAEIIIKDEDETSVAIVATNELERLRQIEAQREARFRILDVIGEKFRQESPSESERRAHRAVSETREVYRREHRTEV
jgi:hypothetical protein